MKRSTLQRVMFTAVSFSLAATFSVAEEIADEPAENPAAAEVDNALPPCAKNRSDENGPSVNDDVVARAPAQPKLIHGVFRYTSYPSAWTVAQKSNRPILVYVTSGGCPHCVRMVEETYKRPGVRRYVTESFEAVYVDRQAQPKLVEKMRIKWFPTTVVVAPNNKVIDKIEGYVESTAFTQRVKTQLAGHDAVLKNAQKALVQK